MPVSLSTDIADRLRAELRAHVQLGRELARTGGEDGRPPLVAVERWRFTAQSLARRGLVDGHPALACFDDHCYRGLLDRRRFERGVDLFEAAARAIDEGGLAFRVGVTRELLYDIVLASDDVPETALDGALWAAMGCLATVAGVRGPGEHPNRTVLSNRLVQEGLIPATLAQQVSSGEREVARSGAAGLLDALK